MNPENNFSPSIKTKKIKLLPVVLLLVGLTVGAISVYFWQQTQVTQKNNIISQKDREISLLSTKNKGVKTTVKSIESEGGNPAPGAITEFITTDKEFLELSTLNRVRSDEADLYWAPKVKISKNGAYARTQAVPVKYTKDEGYQVPAVGGSTFLWHKTDDGWKQIGKCSAGPCNMESGYKEEQIPKDLN